MVPFTPRSLDCTALAPEFAPLTTVDTEVSLPSTLSEPLKVPPAADKLPLKVPLPFIVRVEPSKLSLFFKLKLPLLSRKNPVSVLLKFPAVP